MDAGGKRRVLRDLNAVRRAFVDGPQRVLDACDGIAALLAELDREAAPVAKRNRKGETELHAVCVSSKRHVDAIRELLAAGADPNTKDNAGWTPLHELACKGDADAAAALLDGGAAPDVPGPNNDTPLHEATRGRFLELAELLVARGADPYARNSRGETPLDALDELDERSKRKLIEIAASRPPIRVDDARFALSPKDALRAFVARLRPDDAKKAKALAAAHANLSLAGRLTDACSFVLVEAVDEREARLEYATLTAVALGVPVVNAAWLRKCDESTLRPFDGFELTGLGGRRPCISLSVASGRRTFPRLFDGCHFYFVGLDKPYEISSHLSVDRGALARLVVAGGGVALKRAPNPESIPPDQSKTPYHVERTGALANCSHYIVYGSKPPLTYNMKHCKSLPVGWLIECIQNFTLVDPTPI